MRARFPWCQVRRLIVWWGLSRSVHSPCCLRDWILKDQRSRRTNGSRGWKEQKEKTNLVMVIGPERVLTPKNSVLDEGASLDVPSFRRASPIAPSPYICPSKNNVTPRPVVKCVGDAIKVSADDSGRLSESTWVSVSGCGDDSVNTVWM